MELSNKIFYYSTNFSQIVKWSFHNLVKVKLWLFKADLLPFCSSWLISTSQTWICIRFFKIQITLEYRVSASLIFQNQKLVVWLFTTLTISIIFKLSNMNLYSYSWYSTHIKTKLYLLTNNRQLYHIYLLVLLSFLNLNNLN